MGPEIHRHELGRSGKGYERQHHCLERGDALFRRYSPESDTKYQRKNSYWATEFGPIDGSFPGQGGFVVFQLRNPCELLITHNYQVQLTEAFCR